MSVKRITGGRLGVFVGLAVALVLVGLSLAQARPGRATPAPLATGYDLSLHTLGGVSRASGSGLTVNANVAQTGAGPAASGGSLKVFGGFWAGVGSAQPSETSPTATATPTGGTTTTPTRTATPTGTATATATPTASPSTTVSTTMYFKPSLAEVGVGKVVTLELWVDSGAQPIAAIDAYLDFSKAHLEVVNELGKPLSNTAFITGTALPQVNFNYADNANGQATLSAGIRLGGSPATGSFLFAAVRVSGKQATTPEGTQVVYHFTGNAGDGRNMVLADPSGNAVKATFQPAVVRVTGTSLVGRVQLQGRGSAPNPGWVVPLTVTLQAVGGAGPTYQFSPTTDQNGQFVLTGITPGVYDVRVKKARALTTKRTGVDVVPCDPSSAGTPCSVLDMGMLLEGDANGDNFINSLDYSTLATAFFKHRSEPGFDARVDFNEDGRVNILDYAPLASNFFKQGD